jgi:nucleoside-diphosphate-sugar epimerase
MKIAITGANGFVGSALSKRLGQSHSLLLISRQPISSKDENIVTRNFYHHDFINSLKGCDCIIHLAAKTHSGTRPNKKNLTIYRSVNLKFSLDLAQSALQAGVKRFIYLSSIKVNGEQTYTAPFQVTDIPHPEDAYGISKWEAEQALTDFFKGTNVELVIIRPPLIWSRENLKGNLKLLRKWSDWGLPLPLKGFTNKRDLISIDNLCDFLSLCVEHTAVAGKTFLVSDGVPRSALEIASLVAESPWVISLPKLLQKLVVSTGIGKKLFGNLEVDIGYTLESTGWRPTKTY